MSFNTFIIVAIIVIVASISIIFYMKNKKRKSILENFKLNKEEYSNMIEKISSDLLRTEKISKNEESKHLYDVWHEEFELLEKEFDIFDDKLSVLFTYDSFKKHNIFIEESKVIDGSYFDFSEKLDKLYRKIHNFTEFEIDNTRISLKLKSRIKEVSNRFDIKLNFLEIYNKSFQEEVIEVNGKIAEFELFQKNGDYPKGRDVLKECNRTIEKIEKTFKVLEKFYDFLTQLDNDITIIKQINNEIEKLGFKLSINKFDETIASFIEKKDEIVSQISIVTFEEELYVDFVSTYKEKIDNLDNEITEFKGIVEEKFNFIKSIMAIQKENQELIDVALELIDGSLSEKETINRLYNIKDVRQIEALTNEIDQFKSFLIDYEKLIEIIKNVKEDYVKLEKRVKQANQYLVRLLKNLQKSINELQSIREDELYARNKLVSYQRKIIEFDLYLRKYNHLDCLSENLVSSLEDLQKKYNLLEEELNKEPLDIIVVRDLVDVIETLIKSLVHNSLQDNIKQRIGSNLLIQYINRFNKCDNINGTITKLNNLYYSKEYFSVIKNAHELLVSLSPEKGDNIYRNIVSKVDVMTFVEIFNSEDLKEDDNYEMPKM